MSSVAALPPEVISLIVELAVLTSPPCSNSKDAETRTAADQSASSPFASPLAASAKSEWSQLTSLLYVSRLFYTLARPLLLRTLTLNTTLAGRAFFDHLVAAQESAARPSDLATVRRAWLGNITALKRSNVDLDPLCLKLDEAGWFEECSGGFVVGHTYASRPRPPRPRKPANASSETSATSSKGIEKRFQRVSVYWAEEQLIEEVRNPSDIDSDDEDDEADDSSREQASPSDSYRSSEIQNSAQSLRLNSQLTGDPRVDRPHEPAWQTLYRRTAATSGRNSNGRAEGSSGSARNSRNSLGRRRESTGGVAHTGRTLPAEGDIDPWEMWEAQERLAALPTPSVAPPPPEPAEQDPAQKLNQVLDVHLFDQRRRLRKTEIYAYHLCTATLEPWINTLFSSIRTLRYITLTFTPGHILDDDKLEHMLRRILTRAENPRLEVLLIRMVFEPSVAGSRMRRFERAKTIGGAVDRIADERVRVMLVANVVGQGNLVQTPSESLSAPSATMIVGSTAATVDAATFLSPLSRRAVAITQEAWWSRILQQNRFYAQPPHLPSPNVQFEQSHQPSASTSTPPTESQRIQPWTSFFGYESGRAEWMGKTISHCNPWPDDPISLEDPHYQTSQSVPTQSRQLNYVNGWAARDRDDTNAPIEE